MDLYSDDLKEYLERHTDTEDELLKHIDRETNLKVLMPRMLSGHFQGRVLSMISKMLQPKHILEIGTYTGYATLCLAEGLKPGGRITTIDINAELRPMVEQHFAASGFEKQIDYITGNALDVMDGLTHTFDLVFIDADKKNNLAYFNKVLDKMSSGGVILVDNVLWSGKVLKKDNDKDTESISTFNEAIASDQRVEKLILPVRDGIFVIRKK